MNNDILYLIEAAREQLQQLGLSESTIDTYQQRSFNQIIRRYEKEGDFQYQQTIMDELISEAESLLNSGMISRQTKNMRVRGIKIIQEIQETGAFQWKIFKDDNPYEMPDAFKDAVMAFNDSIDASDRYREEIISITTRFCIFLDCRSIDSFSKASPDDLREFLALMHETRPKSMDKVISPLKKFFIFLERSGEITETFWALLSYPRSREHNVKPAITKEDMIAVINQIDRYQSPGKRDFAVLSLAMTTGLRAGDIASLKLSDIYWKDSEIRLTQGKTGRKIILPLQKDIKDAVADYILNERPGSDCGMVFLRSFPPYQAFHDGVSVAAIFRRYLGKADIPHQLNDGKTFHGIRRTLGTAMVEEGIPVTTVSQVIGHQSIRPTRQYIAMDLEGLRKCALSMESLGGRV